MANELDVRVARVWLGDDGILRCALKAQAAMERSDAEETFRALLSAGGGIPRPVMVLIAAASPTPPAAPSLHIAAAPGATNTPTS